MGSRTLIALLLLAAACGPRPKVVRVEVRREAGRVVALVEVENKGGEGEVSVVVRLRERASGRLLAKEESFPVERRKSFTAAIPIEAPPGDYEASAEADYPR
jgi:hypothetical protein